MNPFRWKLEHLIAWVATCLLGAVIGLAVGFFRYQYSTQGDVGYWFQVWLSDPSEYWPWVAFGGLIAALGFYATKLAKA